VWSSHSNKGSRRTLGDLPVVKCREWVSLKRGRPVPATTRGLASFRGASMWSYSYNVMPDAPEHHHAEHTGHRWLDIVLALSAMFVSVISLIVAIEHGRTMQRMADANARMVQANSWPFLQFDTHNIDEHGNADVRLVISNEGVGPARIETFELWWNGRPMSSPQALIDACCQTTAAERAQLEGTVESLGSLAPSILRAGDHTDFFTMHGNPHNKDVWEKFNVERDKITVRVCYCSVFDECWRASGITTHADPVASCPKPDVPFQLGGR